MPETSNTDEAKSRPWQQKNGEEIGAMNKKLLDLGFAFKHSQLWKTVYEDELFAIHLPEHLILADGSEYVYCAIMGRNGEHRALSVNMGKRGFASLRAIHRNPDDDALENLLSQDCIQCSLETAEQFLPEELEFIREETKKRKMRSPYPQFSRYRPYCVPWHLTDPKDEEILTIALRVTIALAEYLTDHDKSEIGLKNIRILSTREMLGDQIMLESLLQEIDEAEKNQQIPVFTLEEGKLAVDEMIPLPEDTAPDYPRATVIDELKLKTLKKIPKQGFIESQVLRIPEPTKEEAADTAPYLPAILFSVDEDGMVRLLVMMRHAEYDPNEAINDLMKGMIAERFRPAEIHAGTDETISLLETFCKKAGISLVRDENLELLGEATDTMLDRWTSMEDEEDDFGPDEIVEMLEAMTDKELRAMPDFMVAQILNMAESGLLPARVAKKVRSILE